METNEVVTSVEKNFIIQFAGMSIIAGVISALFTVLTDFAHILSLKMYGVNPLIMFVFTPVLFVVISYLLKKYFPYSDGSGLPQGYAVDIFSQETINNTYSIRAMIGKILLTFMSILGGASLGKEGPTIQICASLYASIKGITEKRRRLLIKIGAGAGVAAAFNAPLGGMVFAIEEYIRNINPRTATYLVLGAGLAVYFANLITGNAPYLGYIKPELLFSNYKAGILAVFIGGACGLLGTLFTKGVVFMTVDKTWKINRLRRKHYLVNAFIFGIVVAVIGYYTAGYSFGNGATSVRDFLTHDSHCPWYFAVGKFFGAIASVSAFVPGGYFSTALSIGAGVGDLFQKIIPIDMPLVQFYLLGMVGFLAAITQAPVTAIAMVVEISNSGQFTLPILVSSIVASYIAEIFGDSVYHLQVLNYIDPARYEETN